MQSVQYWPVFFAQLFTTVENPNPVSSELICQHFVHSKLLQCYCMHLYCLIA